MLGRTPEHPSTLGSDRQPNTEVIRIKFVILSTYDKFVGTVSREGAEGCA